MNNGAKMLGLEHIEAEATVLGTAIRDLAFAVDVQDRLAADAFTVPENQLIYEALGNLLHGIEPVDTQAIVNMANGIARQKNVKVVVSREYVSGLAGDFFKASGYITTLQSYRDLRTMSDFAFWFVAKVQDKPNPEQLFIEASDKFRQLMPKSAGSGWVYGWDTAQMRKQIIADRKVQLANGDRKTFDYPWTSWNKVAFPLREGMIGTLYGPTKAGKSNYFDMIAEHWAKFGHHTVLVHLEDALDYKLDRRSARHSKVDYNRIVSGELNASEEKALDDAEKEMQDYFSTRLHYYHAPGKTMHEISLEIDRRRQEGVCDCVVLDYLDKVQPSREQVKLFGDKVYERQAHDMELLKSCMERNSIPCFTGGQGTKEMQDNTELDMKNIAGSGQKLHKAQLVMMFGRKRVGANGMRDSNDRLIAKPGSLSPIIDIGVVAQNQEEGGTWQQLLVGKNFLIKDMPTQ